MNNPKKGILSSNYIPSVHTELSNYLCLKCQKLKRELKLRLALHDHSNDM